MMAFALHNLVIMETRLRKSRSYLVIMSMNGLVPHAINNGVTNVNKSIIWIKAEIFVFKISRTIQPTQFKQSKSNQREPFNVQSAS